jgi:hypothetical protein
MFIRLTLLFSIFIFISCRDRKPKIEVNKTTSQKEASTITPNLKIYIEDGISMHGFFKKGSDFTSDLSKLFSNFPKVNSLDLNLVSGKNPIVKTITKDKSNLIDKIDNIGSEKRELGDTDYPAMLKKVIDAANDSTISVFVSDFIHTSGLSNENAETKIFEILKDKKSKNKNFSVAIFKFSSLFDGLFFYASDYNLKVKGPNKITSIKPYYVWFFGESDLIEKLSLNFNSIKRLNFKSFNDFSIYNEIEYTSKDQQINWTILQYTNAIGTFRPSRIDRNSIDMDNLDSLCITNVKPDRISNEFQVCIAIDLSKIPVSDQTKVDTNNYYLNSNGFSFAAISEVNGDNYNFNYQPMKIDDKDKNKFSAIKPTHLIFLKSKQKVVDNIELSFKRNISTVLQKSNSDDESKLQNLTTYGFRNFTEAIKKSFPKYNDQSYYFTKKITVENKQSSFNILVLLLIIGAVGTVIFVLIKNKK